MAVQKSLKNLHTSGLENKNNLNNDIEMKNKLKNIIYKISLYFIYFRSFNF